MTYLNFGRTSQIRTDDLYHVKALATHQDTLWLSLGWLRTMRPPVPIFSISLVASS